MTARDAAALAQQVVADAVATRDAALEAARRATDEASVADAALDELHNAHLAASMRAAITTGAPCPVCGQVVHTVPLERPEDLHDLEEGVLRLRDRAQAAADRAAETELDVRGAEMALTVRTEAVNEAQVRVTARGGDVTADAEEAAQTDDGGRACQRRGRCPRTRGHRAASQPPNRPPARWPRCTGASIKTAVSWPIWRNA